MNAIFNALKNRTWLAATIVVIAVLATVGFLSASDSSAAEVETVQVVSLTLAETVNASGSLEAQPFARLAWKMGGVVETVYVKPGQAVKKGDVLLTLQPDSTSASAAVAQADLVAAQKNLEDTVNSDSELARATIDLKEAREDYEQKLDNYNYLQTSDKTMLTESRGWYNYNRKGQWTYIAKTRYYPGPASEDVLTEAANEAELARAKMEDLQRKVERLKNNDQDILAAQAKVDAAQATVNSLSIIAPFDGKVLSVEQRAGDVVSAGELSVNVADLNQLYVETQVDESDIAKVKLGAQVEVTLDALPGVKFTGKVSAINPVGEIISGLVKYTVRVGLDKVKSETFLPLGTTANVTVMVKENSATLAVPITAIQNDNNGEYVWALQSDGSAKRVNIVSGSIAGELVVVTGDLQEGDLVQLLARDNSFALPGFGGK